MLRRLWSVILKEFIQIRRDRRTLALILILPAMQLILFGYAINTTVDHIPLGVLDQAQDRESRDFILKFVNSGYFDVVLEVASLDDLRLAVERGTIKAGIVIPPDFSRAMSGGSTATAQILIDGADPNIANTAMFASGSIAQAATFESVSKGRAIVTPLDVRTLVLYNPSLQSVNSMVPGLIGLILQFQTLILTVFAIVRERERGTLEQLIVTPLRPIELLLGKLVPYTLLALLNVMIIVVIAVNWFHVELVGSFPLLMLLSLAFVMSSLGIGMLISTISQTQAQAVQVALLIMLPSMLLAGFLFPRETMPPPLHDIGYLIPLTYFTIIIRGIFLKGVGLDVLWPQVLPMTLFGIAIFTVAVSRFRKTIA